MKKTRTWCDRCDKEFQWDDRGYELLLLSKDNIMVSIKIGHRPSGVNELCNSCFKDIVATGEVAGVSKRHEDN